MSYNPGIVFFIPFHELDPSQQKRCIFFTQKGERCKCYCDVKDNQRAIFLRDYFLKAPIELINLEILSEYAQCNCCARAKHRDRIEDVELLIPLAQRWLEEIRLQASKFLDSIASSSCVQLGKKNKDDSNIPETSIAQVKDAQSSISDISSCDRILTPTSPHILERSSTSRTSHNTPLVPLVSPKVLAVPFLSHQTESRYELRNRQLDGFENAPQILASYTPPILRSEFRPHVNNPSPDDCVYRKMLDPLMDRDFEKGRLYVFDRSSSPGYVKIGWTAKSVSDRLISWSNCGYKPNLLFSTNIVPNAMRAETLTHYELIKEWRRERMCKAPWCGKSHQEWFEITGEQAKRIVSDWANFMEIARPYDKDGLLKLHWKGVIKRIHHESEVVTAEKLLGLCKATMINNTTALKKDVDLSYMPKIKEEISILHPLPIFLKPFEERNSCGDPPSMEHPEISKDTALVKSATSLRKLTGDQLVFSRISPRGISTRKLEPELEIGSAKKEPNPEEKLLPPAPSSQPTISRTIASSQKITQKGSNARAQQLSAKDFVDKASRNMFNDAALHNPNAISCVLLSAQASAVSKNPSSALKKEPFSPSKNSSGPLSSPTEIPLSEIPRFVHRISPPQLLVRHASSKPKTDCRSQGKVPSHIEEAR